MYTLVRNPDTTPDEAGESIADLVGTCAEYVREHEDRLPPTRDAGRWPALGEPEIVHLIPPPRRAPAPR